MKHRGGPAAVEHAFGSQVVGRFQKITVFGIYFIQGEGRMATTALLRMGAAPFFGQEMLQSSEQERAKLSFPPIHATQVISGYQPREKFLGQILSVVGRLPVPAHINVK